ncbi:response regulator [Chloroflexota bacterium]
MAKSKILIISSDGVMSKLIHENLGKGDYHVASTQYIKEELGTILKEESPDLIILDIMMPGQDGIGVCLYIRQLTQVPIIMLSVWGAGEGKIRGLDLSAEDLVLVQLYEEYNQI